MNQEYFSFLDEKISALIKGGARYLSLENVREIQEFLDAGEYGLALGAYVSFAEIRGEISAEVFIEVELLVEIMEMDDKDIDLESLRKIRK
jgi:hypothetical protein